MRPVALLVLASCGRVAFDPLGSGDAAVDDGFRLAARGIHSCRILDGALHCWGNNAEGELGVGDFAQHPTPVRVPATWDRVWVGEWSTCARVAAGGQTWCWGRNDQQQLSLPASSDLNVPALTGLPAGIDEIALGEAHGCALSGGEVLCWGRNVCQQVSTSPTSPMFPTKVPGLTGIKHVSAHDAQTCVIDSADQVKCWGAWDAIAGTANEYSTCGTPLPSFPTTIALPLPAVQLDSGCHATSCARLTDGSMWCWGANDYGGIGNNSTNPAYAATRTQRFGNALPVIEMTVGSFTSCAIADDGVYCWGRNDNGEIGDNSLVQAMTPKRIPFFDGKVVTAIGQGCFHGCARVDGEIVCWGYNGDFQIGDGTQVRRLVPTAVHFDP